MFSRLWWQAFLLTEQTAEGRDTTLLDALQESEINQLLERLRLGGNRTLVRALARAVVAHRDEGTYTRLDLVREAALRMRRRAAMIDFGTCQGG